MFPLKHRLLFFCCLQLAACSFWLSSCTTIDLYEKVVPIPAHQWRSSYKPQFTFQIKDTAVPYQAFIILRHNNKYNYNNIWVNLLANGPADSIQKLGLELPLANKEGWLGTGMDDLFEHRIRIGNEIGKLGFVKPGADGFHFTKPGDYTFTLEQIMRDDPLTGVMNVGLRLEKKMP
jgi:gliding motility-associated lipoprotein GldH